LARLDQQHANVDQNESQLDYRHEGSVLDPAGEQKMEDYEIKSSFHLFEHESAARRTF
jgi:hypothetical protein